jgi:hypothetical protein
MPKHEQGHHQAADASKETSVGATETAPTPAETASVAGAYGAAAATAPTGDTRFISIKLDDEGAKAMGTKADGTAYAAGDVVKRKEYILSRWGQKVGRGPIAKELTRLEGKNVAYQIVFQATDKVPGGPDKAAPAAPVTTAPTTETAATEGAAA